MKNKLIYGLCALFVAAAMFGIFSAFNAPNVSPESAEMEMAAGTVGGYLTYDYRKDTLTNAEANTLNVGKRDNSIWNTVTTPVNFFSLYTYDIKVVPLSLSGTLSVKVVLDASNMRSGTSTDWCAIDSITGTTAGRTLQLRSTDATASRYRIRVIGSGTQSTTYQVWSMWKRKN